MNSQLGATAWEAKADRTSSRTRNEMQQIPGAASTASPGRSGVIESGPWVSQFAPSETARRLQFSIINDDKQRGAP